MARLQFELISPEEKEFFRNTFREYLEELDLMVGDSIEPDFKKRYPGYEDFFMEDSNHQPFRIYYSDEKEDSVAKNVGFFLLRLITPAEIPTKITSIFDENVPIAYLTDFYIFKDFRGQKMAWQFYNAIIDLCTDPINQWHCAWECDCRNIPALNFYGKVLERIQQDHPYQVLKETYQNPQTNKEYCYYQVLFES